MKAAATPANEDARVASLRLLNILDTQPEERFDRLTRMARRLFSVPVAQVTLVDADRQWFKSSDGVSARETPRDVSLCAHAILGEEVFTVPDTLLDDRFADNPLVTANPGIRFYAGCPLTVGEHRLGTLCVTDDKPREFGAEEQELLRDLAQMAERELSAMQLAITDELTGLSNRRGFDTLARQALRLCRRLHRHATLLYFDLDGFKQINDRHGHAEGDRALKKFAQGLLSVFRDCDVVGRLGGDEFAVLLTGTDGTPIDTIARLKRWLRLNNAESEYEIEFSLGHHKVDPEGQGNIDQLLARADAAMYKDKLGEAGQASPL